jgi:hypothetical protein
MIAFLGQAFVTALEGHALGLRQARGEDPHELRRRRRPHLGPCVRQVVLDRRVRQAEAVGSRLLRPRNQDRFNRPDLAVRRPLRGQLVSISPDAAVNVDPN